MNILCILPPSLVISTEISPALCLVLLQVSYFEIYMDKIRDLLDGLCHNTHK